jgi:CBS-domain-containing membrane protein
MAQRRVHAVFVLSEARRPEGVVSDFDMLAGEWLGDDKEGLSTMKSMTAGDLMTSPIETIAADATLVAAAAHMRELHLSRLLATDEQGAAVGVISISDLVAPLGSERRGRRTVRDVMSFGIMTCTPETALAAVARAMTERRSRSIVVVDEAGEAAGVITGSDLLTLYESTQSATTARDLMRRPITCDIDLPLRDAIDLIIRKEVHRVVITDSSTGDAMPAGLLSTSDVIREIAQEGSVWQVR